MSPGSWIPGRPVPCGRVAHPAAGALLRLRCHGGGSAAAPRPIGRALRGQIQASCTQSRRVLQRVSGRNRRRMKDATGVRGAERLFLRIFGPGHSFSAMRAAFLDGTPRLAPAREVAVLLPWSPRHQLRGA